MASLQALDDHLILEIFTQYLPQEDWLNFALVSNRFNYIYKQPVVWKTCISSLDWQSVTKPVLRFCRNLSDQSYARKFAFSYALHHKKLISSFKKGEIIQYSYGWKLLAIHGTQVLENPETLLKAIILLGENIHSDFQCERWNRELTLCLITFLNPNESQKKSYFNSELSIIKSSLPCIEYLITLFSSDQLKVLKDTFKGDNIYQLASLSGSLDVLTFLINKSFNDSDDDNNNNNGSDTNNNELKLIKLWIQKTYLEDRNSNRKSVFDLIFCETGNLEILMYIWKKIIWLIDNNQTRNMIKLEWLGQNHIKVAVGSGFINILKYVAEQDTNFLDDNTFLCKLICLAARANREKVFDWCLDRLIEKNKNNNEFKMNKMITHVVRQIAYDSTDVTVPVFIEACLSGCYDIFLKLINENNLSIADMCINLIRSNIYLYDRNSNEDWECHVTQHWKRRIMIDKVKVLNVTIQSYCVVLYFRNERNRIQSNDDKKKKAIEAVFWGEWERIDNYIKIINWLIEKKEKEDEMAKRERGDDGEYRSCLFYIWATRNHIEKSNAQAVKCNTAVPPKENLKLLEDLEKLIQKYCQLDSSGDEIWVELDNIPYSVVLSPLASNEAG